MIFLTGATGFLGREVLSRLVLDSSNTATSFSGCQNPAWGDEKIGLLIRGKDFQRRGEILCRELLGSTDPLKSGKVTLIPGDLTRENFGLNSASFNSLSRATTRIIHCGALTSFAFSLEQARAVNVVGTKNILRLAERASELPATTSSDTPSRKVRLTYVSTAFVAGDSEKIHSPYDLELDTNFKNSYERSKAEAESLVRQAKGDYETTILRPSMIVGHSITGEASAFNVVYIPIRLVLRGLLTFLPVTPSTPCDIVPVDYVADRVLRATFMAEAANRSFHLTAGLGRETSPLEILDLVTAAAAKHITTGHFAPPKLISPEFFYKLYPELLQLAATSAAQTVKMIERHIPPLSPRLQPFAQLLPLLPYLIRNPRFDSSVADLDFGPLPPLFSNYANRLFDYCILSDWGRRTMSPTSN